MFFPKKCNIAKQITLCQLLMIHDPYAFHMAYENIFRKVYEMYTNFFCLLLFKNTFFFFQGCIQQHMEVHRLRSEWSYSCRPTPTTIAMPDLSHICDLHHSSWQCQILNPLRPGTEPVSSRILVRFISTEPHWELLKNIILIYVNAFSSTRNEFYAFYLYTFASLDYEPNKATK